MRGEDLKGARKEKEREREEERRAIMREERKNEGGIELCRGEGKTIGM